MPPAVAQRPPHAGQGRLLVGEVDEPDPRDHCVERAGRELVERLAVGLERLDVRDARLGRGLGGEGEDRRRDVRRHDPAARTDPAGGGQGLPARAGGDVENLRRRSRPGGVEHRLGGRPQPGLEGGPQRCHASAASSHCWRVVALYWIGSKLIVISSGRGS